VVSKELQRASERQVQREQAEEEKKLRKADMKELKASNTLFNKKLQEERRVKRERVKKEREREGKEGPGTGPKETTEREGKTSCTDQKNCAFIPNNPSYNLKETGT
jgi:hypothetical protein